MSRLSLIWRVPSSFFGNIYRAIFLSENAFLRNIRKQAKKKKREEELGRFGCVGIASHSQGALPNFQRLVSDDRKPQTIRTGNSGRHTKEGKLSSWLSFFFEESNLECREKRKVKVTENYIENTDFAYAATSRPGHMPRQLPARLSGIRSIAKARKFTAAIS